MKDFDLAKEICKALENAERESKKNIYLLKPGAPEKTVLYWLVNGMIVNEKPPEIFFKITSLLLRLQTNVDHIWLGHGNLSEKTKHKYHRFSKELNDCDCEITFKGLFADAHYGENRK